MHEAHFNVALSLAYQGKLSESVASFVSARSLHPDIPGLDATLLEVLLQILQDEHGADCASSAQFAPLPPEPLVSVVIPTQNRVPLLRDALESVCRQTYRNWEAVVVNDGGADISAVVKSMPSHLFSRITSIQSAHPRGQANARNVGVAAARGELIAFLDDDDLHKPGHLAALVQGLRESGAALAYTRAEAVWERLDGEQRIVLRRGPASPWFRYSRALLLVRNAMPLQNCAMRRECFERFGNFDEEVSCAEDWELLLRFSANAEFRQIAEMTTEIHVREDAIDSVSKRNPLRPMCELFYRRFAAGGNELVVLARELYLKSLT
jgi:glycosyltransferase involved in cell wall biosynthesis